jgi:hypothetical protein
MTQCCNDFGKCTQGFDCPVRKQKTMADTLCKAEIYENDHGKFIELIAWLALISSFGLLIITWRFL